MKKNLLLLFLTIPFLMNAQLRMDDFESYTVGDFDPQWNETEWVGWFDTFSGAEISDEQASSGSHSMKISESPFADDIMALTSVLNSGIHEIEFKQYIPAENGAYFNLQHNYTSTSGDWAVDVLFSDAVAAQGMVTTNGEDFTFDIVHDTWATILFILNFDTEIGEFYYNDQLINTWSIPTNVAGGPALNAINGINFFATCNTNVGNCTSLAYYDDVRVEEGSLPEFNVSLNSENMEAEYAIIPLSQAEPLALSATVSNNGATTVNNVSVIASVYDEDDNEVYSESLGNIPSLSTGESAVFNSPANSFTANTAGTYSVEYVATLDELDDIMDGNLDVSEFIVSDSIYARDNGEYNNGLGSNGEPGIFGHLYSVVNTAEVTGINISYAGAPIGETAQGRIMALSSTGNPSDIIALTDVVTIQEAGALGAAVEISFRFDTPVELEPGNYAFMVEQQGNTSLGVSLSDNIFTANTSFLSINDGATWDRLEDIGFIASLAIRPVFSGVTVGVEELDFASNIELTPNVTSGRTTLSLDLESNKDLLIDIYDIHGKQVYTKTLNNAQGIVNHELDLSGQLSGMYFVTISSEGKRTSRKISLIK